MTARTISRKKKAIEPIVAAILLIAIAIVAGALLYLWVSRLTAGAQTNAPVNGNVQVLAAYYKPNAKTLIVIIKSPSAITSKDIETLIVYYANNGTVAKAIVNGTSSTITVTSVSDHIYNITASSVALSPGTYYVRIVTKVIGTITTPTFTVS